MKSALLTTLYIDVVYNSSVLKKLLVHRKTKEHKYQSEVFIQQKNSTDIISVRTLPACAR